MIWRSRAAQLNAVPGPRAARSQTSALMMKEGSANGVVGQARVFGWAVGAAVIGSVALALWQTGSWEPAWELFSDRERVQRVVEGAGILAPAVYVLLLVVQAVLAPLPAPAVAVAGGFVFGTFEGFLLTWSGAALGGVVSFGLSRLFGRGYVTRSPRARRLDRYVEEHGAILIFILRLVPLVSFDAISYAAGLTGIAFRKFFVATMLGMAPGTFAFVYLGGASPGPGAYAVLGVLALLAVGAYLYSKRRFR